jgi:hypothetical protein
VDVLDAFGDDEQPHAIDKPISATRTSLTFTAKTLQQTPPRVSRQHSQNPVALRIDHPRTPPVCLETKARATPS